jgi:multimeric flavodoxin WrbA
MKELENLISYLNNKDCKVLLLTTSNRWEGQKEQPKSSILAAQIAKEIKSSQVINVSKLRIFPCEGNVSTHGGNTCGLKDAVLKDRKKNPTGEVRCWASVNNSSDEMHTVANAILDADVVLFFGSIRWGKMNAIYANLIERLTWLENRHTTLGESNLLKDKEAGVIAVGHNWNGKESVELEKEVLRFFGFNTPKQLSFSWQYLKDAKDETKDGYKKEFGSFTKDFGILATLKESVEKFKDYFKRNVR